MQTRSTAEVVLARKLAGDIRERRNHAARIAVEKLKQRGKPSMPERKVFELLAAKRRGGKTR